MGSDPEIEDDRYRESEDEDYDPGREVEAAESESDPEEAKKDEQKYAEFQGRGGLIRTRAQRRRDAEEGTKSDTAKPSTVKGEASVDVDALWAEMNSAPPKRPLKSVSPTPSGELATSKAGLEGTSGGTPSPKDSPSSNSHMIAATDERMAPSKTQRGPTEEYITIERTFKFAGEVRTETKHVLAASAEGQDYLRQKKEREAAKVKSQGRVPVKRKMSLMEEYQMNKNAKKINTLEKSRLDWLGFVDEQGIREDLTKHNKSGYLDRQGFLDRVDRKLEQDLRQQRVKRMQQQ